MSRETAVFARVPAGAWETDIGPVAQKAERARERAGKADPGDRREAARYDVFCRALDEAVRALVEGGAQTAEGVPAPAAGPRHPWTAPRGAVRDGAPDSVSAWVAGGDAAYELRDPFRAGATAIPDTKEASEPGDVWRAPAGAHGEAARTARWQEQLAAAVSKPGSPIVPSGVDNRVLSRGLRDFVAAVLGEPAVRAKLVWRDGSETDAGFPLRALALRDEAPADWPALRVALISMRHPEMDPEVDFAWLRNRDVSVVRPAAETEEFVYESTRRGLRELAARGHFRLYLRQTGLEPAVVGFYRALAEHLSEMPGSLAVIPCHYHGGVGKFEEDPPWMV